MPTSDAKRRANARYQAKTIASLACRVKKEQAEAFKAHCESVGKTSNAVLKDFVLGCIGEQEPGAPQEAPGRPRGVSLPPDVLRVAQTAAAATGEAPAAFIARAVQTQAERDNAFLKMSINPATGDKMKREA